MMDTKTLAVGQYVDFESATPIIHYRFYGKVVEKTPEGVVVEVMGGSIGNARVGWAGDLGIVLKRRRIEGKNVLAFLQVPIVMPAR